MKPHRLLTWLFGIAIALLPFSAEATIAKAIAFEEKVENAAAIVLGRCVAQESRWDDAREWILTYSTFEIEKTLKGVPARTITLVTPGGKVGNIAQEVVGAPRFRTGAEHVVFVRESQVGPTVLYLEQGAYGVDEDSRGERIVQPLVSSAVLVDSQRGMAVSPERPRPLREFERAVRDTVRTKEEVHMQMLERQKREQASLVNVVRRNAPLIALALIGALLATWQLAKRW